MQYPLISVVMPSYRSRSTIRRAVLSVLEQSWPSTEVIVVDNSSDDGTPDLVRELIKEANASGRERIRLIEQPNKGVSSARNAGIRAVRGKFFVSLDADDYYEPETLSRLYGAMLSASRPEAPCDTVICGMRKVYEGREEENEEFLPAAAFDGTLAEFAKEHFTALYDLHLISTHSNKLYRTALVREKEILYRDELQVNEDIDFVLRYLAVCRRAAVIPYIGLDYVQHGTGQSLINTFQPHGLKGAVIVLASCRALMEASGASGRAASEMDERMFVHICSFAGLMYYRSGYSPARIRQELTKLCGEPEFEALLARLSPRGLKNRAAAVLLKNKWVRAYDLVCRILYKSMK